MSDIVSPYLLLLVGVFLFLGTVITKPSRRYGVPALILYMGIGFVFGNGSEYDFLFDYPAYVSFYAQLAIGFIVFVGGVATPLKLIKTAWIEGAMLSSLAVVVTCLAVAFFTHWMFGIDLKVCLLLGAILSATDAAAVFSILEAKNIKLKENISETLELESSTNDPMSYFLVIALTSLISTGEPLSTNLLIDLFISITGGFVVGGVAGWFSCTLLRKINFEINGLYPIFILSIFLFVLGISPLVHANSLLALYIAGVSIGNFAEKARTHSSGFFEGMSWLMQISLFIVLGLQADPPRIISYITMATLIALFLIVAARPLAVWMVYWFVKASKEKILFISWVGLRGATPIAFSLIPLTAPIREGSLLFDIAFLVVCLSVMIQGTTLDIAARYLNLIDEEPVSSAPSTASE